VIGSRRPAERRARCGGTRCASLSAVIAAHTTGILREL
jgi:hypothetical protein